jgi:hypothetical protein
VTLDQAWLAKVVQATAERPATGLHGSAQLLVGKVAQVSLEVEDGRVIGNASGTPDCQMPLSKGQIKALEQGEIKLAVEYMRGDFKPTGSTAAILAVIDALDAAHQPG